MFVSELRYQNLLADYLEDYRNNYLLFGRFKKKQIINSQVNGIKLVTAPHRFTFYLTSILESSF